jgi:hypothetical protein
MSLSSKTPQKKVSGGKDASESKTGSQAASKKPEIPSQKRTSDNPIVATVPVDNNEQEVN